MENQFVSYELALELKKLGIDDKGKFNPEIGFNEPCFARYRRGKFQLNTLGKPHRYNSDEIVKGDVSAPLWQQAFKFATTRANLDAEKQLLAFSLDGKSDLGLYQWWDYEGFSIEAEVSNAEALDYLIKLIKRQNGESI